MLVFFLGLYTISITISLFTFKCDYFLNYCFQWSIYLLNLIDISLFTERPQPSSPASAMSDSNVHVAAVSSKYRDNDIYAENSMDASDSHLDPDDICETSSNENRTGKLTHCEKYLRKFCFIFAVSLIKNNSIFSRKYTRYAATFTR